MKQQKLIITALLLSLIGGLTAIFLLQGGNQVSAQSQQSISSNDGGLDLIATGMEVTQGTQNLANTVRLVAGKTTFVRFYVRSNGNNAVTTARLTVTQGNTTVNLFPVNPGGEINVLANPNRRFVNQSFLFQLPESVTNAGTVALSAEVNPAPNNPVEVDYTNNIWQIPAGSLQFETVPPLDLVIYNIGYRVNGVDYFANDLDRNQMVDYMRRAYPVSQIRFELRKESIREALGADRLPECDEVNRFLQAKRNYDLQTGAVTPQARYYGMVSDGGGFLRGCADGLPGFTSSGPTGTPTSTFAAWDTDGTYGDWYGAHEVAHNLERYHAEFCEASDGRPFPNPGASISPTTTGPNTVFGYDIGTGAIYDTTWTDNLAYCDRQWLSDFSHNGVMTFLQGTAFQPSFVSLAAQDSLYVSGTIFPGQNPAIRLDPAFFVDEAVDVTNPVPGNYAIVLRNSAGTELRRYPFTPEEVMEEEDTRLPNPPDAPEILRISEFVPYSAGTARVEVVGPNQTVLGSITAGTAAPTVIGVTTGNYTPGQPLTVSWTALDLNNDPLTFHIQYSDDNGASWRIVSAYLRAASIGGGPVFSTTVDPFDITTGAQARFRVIASDGINTGSADSAAFNVPNNPPTVAITEPGDDSTISLGESVTFRADAYDVDEGLPPVNEMQWSSSINGALGNGNELTVSNLSLGEHTITFRVNDGNGGVVTDTITLEVTNERVRQSVNDYDGDGESDVAVFRPSNGTWYISQSSDGELVGIPWGNSTDIPVQADYDNDGTTDVAVFRPSNGFWYIRQSSRNTLRAVQWGLNGDIPVAADYDGDAKIDLAVFRPSSGSWFIQQSSDGRLRSIVWGASTDKPVPADYDGDTLTDIAVFRPGNNFWYIINSSNGAQNFRQLGSANDLTVVEDYDGDGENDIAAWQPSNGLFKINGSANGTLFGFQWGLSGDRPVPGDYDGDGAADFVVYRPSNGTWYIRQSSNGLFRAVRFGASTDVPV